MKRAIFITLALLLVVAAGAQAQTPPQPQAARQGTAMGPNFIDSNGDGICDNFQMGPRANRAQMQNRRGFGPGDGTGNKGVGPRDGTGFGAQAGGGVCDGTGPKGRGRGGRR